MWPWMMARASGSVRVMFSYCIWRISLPDHLQCFGPPWAIQKRAAESDRVRRSILRLVPRVRKGRDRTIVLQTCSKEF